jgi:hypothetical protein
MVQGVGDDGVVLAQQRLEQAAVGVEAGRIQDGVVLAEEAGNLRLQLLVQVLGAADEAYRGHAEAVAVQCVLGRLDQVRVVGQAQVVVGAEIQHLAAIVQGDFGRLRAGDDALGLEQALFADGVELLRITGSERCGGASVGHGEESGRKSPILPLPGNYGSGC